MLDRKLTWNSSRLTIERWNEGDPMIDPIYSAVRVLIYYTIYNYDY